MKGATVESAPIAVTRLKDVFHRPTEPRLPPIVVLDPARPSYQTEAGRHLLLRNRFASQLFALGSAPIVVATGLFSSYDRNVLETFIGTLASGGAIAEACAAVRAEARDVRRGLDEVLASLGVALFVDVAPRAWTRVVGW
jgi:hypothetical protein